MKIPYHELLSCISIGDVVSFKHIEQLQSDPSFRQQFDPSGYSGFVSTDALRDFGEHKHTLTMNKVWTHIPTQERVYAHSNYTASPGEKFIILDGREMSYVREEAIVNTPHFDLFKTTQDHRTLTTPVKTYVFDLQKVDAPHVNLKRVICDVLNFEIKYGNIRILAEVKK